MRFSKPTLKVCSVDTTNRKYVIDIQNLSKTMGHSIGNAITRGLMTAPCYKAKAYRLEGVQHEFDSVTCIVQDVETISNNVGRVIIPPYEGVERLEFKYSGLVDGRLTAGDFVCATSGVGEIVNKDLLILETAENIFVNMTIIAEKGIGHELPPYREFNEIGLVSLPVVYSGIQASYEVIEDKPYAGTETVRLYIISNGGYDVKDTVELVCRQFTAYFDIIANTFASISINASGKDIVASKVTKVASVRLEDLDLSTAVYDRLKLHYNEVTMKDGDTILLPPSDEREKCKELLEGCGLKVELI